MPKKYKNNLQAARDFDPYAKDVSMEDLQRIRRQLAKVMNQRMVRLEQAKSPVSGEAYTFGAYEKMQDYLDAKGRHRFSELKDPHMTAAQLKKEIKVLQGFEETPSSRVAGMRQIEKKRISAFTDKGMDPATVSNKDFYDFLNGQTFERISRIIDSDRIIEEYNRVSKEGASMNDIVKALDDYMDKAKRVSVKGIRQKLRMTTVKKPRKRRK